jgi:hypothetical protein
MKKIKGISKIKKALSISLLMLVAFLGLGQNVMAEPCSKEELTEIRGNTLLGLPPWYKYLPGERVEQVVPDGSGGFSTVILCQPTIEAQDGEKIPRTHILLIVAAVLEILTRAAGLAAFIYLLYGGFMYLTSNGNSENVKNAGTTLLNAAIGLAIAISATTIINFFAGRLGAP